MATSFKQQNHVNITLQYSITHIHFLSGWLPFHGLLLLIWQRSVVSECQIHSLFSAKTQTRNQRRKKMYYSYAMQNFFFYYKFLRELTGEVFFGWLIWNTILNNSVGCNSMLLLDLAPIKLVNLSLDIESLTSDIKNRISYILVLKYLMASFYTRKHCSKLNVSLC